VPANTASYLTFYYSIHQLQYAEKEEQRVTSDDPLEVKVKTNFKMQNIWKKYVWLHKLQFRQH